MNIGIVGYGIVGKAVELGFKDACEITIYDPAIKESKTTLYDIVHDCSFIFVSVPTPFNTQTQLVDDAIISDTIYALNFFATSLNKKPTVIIKSAIVPRIVREWITKHPSLDIVISPEYLREKHYKHDFVNQQCMILGGERAICLDVARLYTDYSICNKKCKIGYCSAEEAALIKYMENSFLGLRNIFFNQFKEYYDAYFDTTDSYNFNNLMDVFHLDDRMGILPTPYRIPGPDGDRGYGGKCLPKDIQAIIHEGDLLKIDLSLMKEVHNSNEKIRTDRDWERINGAIS